MKYLGTKTETWTHLTDIPEEHSRNGCKVCCVEGNIYLIGGDSDDKRVTEYNPRTNTWRTMPSLQEERVGYSVCTLDNKIFVLGGNGDTTCEMLDLSEDDPHWRYIALMNYNCGYHDSAVVIEGKIFVLGFETTSFEVYNVDQGIFMKYIF